jgi:acetyl-CoA acetyltransferase
MSREVVVVSAVRTAIGTFGGSLKDQAPTELGALVVRESLARAGVDGQDVGHVVFGHVVNTEPKDMYHSTSTVCAAQACRPSCRHHKASCSATPTWPSVVVRKT